MQRDRRLSRPLLAGLAVVIVLGLFFYLHNVSRSRAVERAAKDAQARAEAQNQALKAAADPPTTKPSVATPASTADAGPLVTTTPPLQRDAVAYADPHAPAANPSGPPSAASSGAGSNASSTTPGHDGLADFAQPHAAPTATLVSSSQPLVDAESQKKAGNLIAARDLLNTALLSGKLSAADADSARASISEISQAVFFSPKRFSDTWSESYEVQNGERLSTIAVKHGTTWQLLSRVNGIDPKHLRAGATIKVIHGPFHAVVTKSKFRMDLYLGSPGQAGSLFVTSFPVGLGKDDSTPTGTWQAQSGNKIRNPRYYSPRGEGVIEAEDPKNPLGGYWIGLEGLDGQAVGKNSYGIHGTIDPDSIGKQASMGCIRLRHDDIAMVFDMLVDGKSKIIVNP